MSGILVWFRRAIFRAAGAVDSTAATLGEDMDPYLAALVADDHHPDWALERIAQIGSPMLAALDAVDRNWRSPEFGMVAGIDVILPRGRNGDGDPVGPSPVHVRLRCFDRSFLGSSLGVTPATPRRRRNTSPLEWVFEAGIVGNGVAVLRREAEWSGGRTAPREVDGAVLEEMASWFLNGRVPDSWLVGGTVPN